MIFSGEEARNGAKESLYCRSRSIKSYANRAPCTTVFRMVEEIENYIGTRLS